MEKPYNPADHQFEWMATVPRSDGSLMERRFWMHPADGERAAKWRAFEIWNEARVGSDQSMVNPKLKVTPVGYRPRANTRKGNMAEVVVAAHALIGPWHVTQADWKIGEVERAAALKRIATLRTALDKLERSL